MEQKENINKKREKSLFTLRQKDGDGGRISLERGGIIELHDNLINPNHDLYNFHQITRLILDLYSDLHHVSL